MMKILVIVNDSWSVYNEYTHTGILPQAKRRAVEIELTSDQISKIGLQKIGTNGGKDAMETVESVSLLIENE